MMPHQRGAVSLVWVALLSGLVAVVGVVALISMRNERNLFAEGVDKATAAVEASGAKKALQAAGDSVSGTDRRMKKCIIKGKTVISNTDCPDTNQTTRVIAITEGNVADAVKVPVAPAAQATSDPMIDKIIEKQLH